MTGTCPLGVFFLADRRQMPQDRVPGGHPPSGVEHPDQRLPRQKRRLAAVMSMAAAVSAVACSSTAASSAFLEGKWA